MAEAFGTACHELVSLDFRCGSSFPFRSVADQRPQLGELPKESG